MASIVIAMIVILLLASATLVIVVMGMQGRGKGRLPRLAHRAAQAARHLNGDGEPPARFVRVIESTLQR